MEQLHISIKTVLKITDIITIYILDNLCFDAVSVDFLRIDAVITYIFETLVILLESIGFLEKILTI